jgi:hypothetical protein
MSHWLHNTKLYSVTTPYGALGQLDRIYQNQCPVEGPNQGEKQHDESNKNLCTCTAVFGSDGIGSVRRWGWWIKLRFSSVANWGQHGSCTSLIHNANDPIGHNLRLRQDASQFSG